MKKIYKLILLFALLCCGTTVKAAAAYYVVDGIRYYASSTSTKNVLVTALSSGKYSGDIVVPGSFVYNSYTYTVTGIKGNAFDGCTALTSVTIEEGPTTLEMYSFYNCSALKTVSLPATLTSATYYAFYGCAALESVTFAGSTPPSTFYASGSWPTFYNCPNLSAIYVPADAVETYKTAWAGSTLADLVQTESVSSCAKPTNVIASQNTPVKATLSWTKAEGKDNYQYLYVAKGETPNWNSVVAQNANSVEIDGLTSGVEYDFYVRTYCDSEDQSEAVKKTFSVTCPAPTFPTTPVTDLSASGATITWNAVDGISKYQYLCVVKDADTTGLWAAVEAKEGLSAELTSLTAKTHYDFYVRSWYSATSISDAVKTTFRTDADCSAIVVDADHTWEEDFSGFEVGNENSDAPDCWALLNANAGSRPYIYISASGTSWFSLSNNALYFSNVNTKYGYAIFPAFATALNTLQITFDQKVESASSSGAIELGYMTNITDESTFNLLLSCNKSTSWKSENVILTAVPAGARLAFRYKATSTSSYFDAAVDNITVSLAPSCTKPSEIKTTALDSVSATITWTNGGEETSWKLRYSTDQENWTVANEGNAFTTKPFVLNGLTESTTYYVQVAAVCGVSDESDWSVAGNFTTDCGAYSLPFSEAFSSSLSSCWRTNAWAPSSSQRVSLSYSMSFSAYYATTEEYGDLITPFINLGNQESNLTFQLHNYSEVVGELYIVVGSTTTKLMTLPKATAWTKQTVDLTAYVGQTAKFIFRAYGNGGTSYKYIYIDDVAVVVKPCATPTGLAAVKGNAIAEISWTDEEADKWNIRYRIVAEPENEWTLVNGLTAKSHTLEGLTNGAEYEVQVQAVCSETRTSDWTASVKFTPEACPTVAEVTLGAKTYNSVVVNWATSSASNCDVRYSTDNGENWTVAEENIAATTYTLSGLSIGAVYTIAVKPSCGDDEAWVAAETFTPAYSIPANVAVASITDVAASASWDAVADADSYQYIVLASGEPNWESATAAAENSASLTGLSAGTAYTLYVRSVYSTGYSEAASANFPTITIAPQNLQQDGESTTTSATFTWEANGAATQYQWSIDNTNWSEPIAALTATATGLKSGSSYTFYVRSYYNADVQSAAISLPFQTECAVETLPFSQDFGTTSATKPACWNIEKWGTSANYWTTASDYAKTGVALKYNAKTNNSSDAITPSIEISDKCELKFYIRNAVGSYSAKVESKVLVNDGSATTELASITTRYATATLQTIDLSDYIGKTITIIFRGLGYGSDTNSSLWIDDVTVSFKPVATPTNVVATSANEGATITWQSEEGASWNLRYRVVDTEDWTTLEGLTEKTKELTGLTNGTTYEVQVQAVVSANRQSEWTDSKTFTPQACASVETVTFGAQTYNSIVVNWTTSGAGTWNLDFKQGDLDWVERHDLTEQTLTLNDLATGIEYTVVVYPTCNAEGAVQNTFTLGYTAPVAAEAENITDAAATVQWLAVADASSYEYDFVLPGDEADWKGTSELSATASNLAAGTDYLFVVRSVYPTGQSDADTTEFKTITIAPTALVKEAATTESITFSWSYAGAATQFQYKVNDGEWSAAQTALTATAEGLSAGTTYTIYVRAYYADGKYSAELSGDLSTECGIYALPYEQNFEAEGLPLCWETENWGTDANQWGRSSEYKKTGYYSIRYNANTDSYAEISLPTIHLDDIAVLTFYTRNSYYANYSYNYVSGKVIVSAAGEEPQEVAINNNSAYSLAEQTIELDSKFVDKDVTITFHAEGVGASAYLYIDDVTVIAKPCPTTSLTATAALDSVVLTWSGDATQYQYCIEEGTAEPSAWTLLDEDVFTVTVKGLTPNQAYTAYVRSYCSASKQGEAAKQAFTPACPAPTALVVDEVSTTTATLSWTAAAGISKYQYRLGTDEWSNENVVEGTSVELTSLSPATTYTLYVRSWYNADVQSTTAITKSFTTECAAVALPFDEDFADAIPCWTLVDCHSDSKVSGGQFQFHYNTNPPQYLISPELVPTVQNVKVQFEYKGQSTSYKEEFQLGYSLTTKEIAAFAWSDTVFCQETDYQDYVQVVPAGVRYIAIRYTANNQYYLYIDNFSAEETTDYPTALDNAGAEGAKATKRLENNVLIIEFNGVQYNAQGQLLKK